MSTPFNNRLRKTFEAKNKENKENKEKEEKEKEKEEKTKGDTITSVNYRITDNPECETEGIEKTEEAGVNLSFNNLLRAEREIKKTKRERIASILNTTIDRISIQGKKWDQYENGYMNDPTSGNTLYHHGSLDFGNYVSYGGDTLPRIVSGNLDFYNMKSAKNLILPDIIMGSLILASLPKIKGIIRWPSHIGFRVRVSEKLSRRDREFLENKYPGRVTTFL